MMVSTLSKVTTEGYTAKLKAGLFLSDGNLFNQTKPLFERSGLAVEGSDKIDGQVWDKIPSSQLSSLAVAVFDLRNQENLLATARELVDRCPSDAVIVVLGRSSDLELYRSLKSVGVADYLADPIMADDLAATVLTLTGLAAKNERLPGRVITVYGVRGGNGSGLISAGLSAFLAQEHGRSVATVDSVVSAPTVDGYLGVNAPGNLGVLLSAGERLDKILLSQAVQKPLDNVGLLSGYLPPDHNLEGLPGNVSRLSLLLGDQYRYQIWRCQAGASLEGQLLAIGQVIVILATGSIPCVRGAKNVYQWVLSNNKSARIILVYNQVSPDQVFPPAQLAKSLGFEFQLVIPYVKGLSRDLVNEVPLTDRKHAFHKHLAALTRLVLGRAEVEEPSLWSKLFRRVN
jgi:pilus assembly protein CpaE